MSDLASPLEALFPSPVDVAVVGAGAAGVATAIFARRLAPLRTVVVLEGAKRPGAKILVSGGSRCNVTNVAVRELDFWGGRRTIVRRVLRAMAVDQTVAFFREIGVDLHEEADGKLFPDTNSARDVLQALLSALTRAGAALEANTRVNGVARTATGFRLDTSRGRLEARSVVLATGGQSLPKSGSDGLGYALAGALGHTIVPTTPGLAGLVLADPTIALSGVSHQGELTVWVDGVAATRLYGSLLWTHFGVSGPLALNASRHWARADLEGRRPAVTLSCCPGERFDTVDRRLLAMGRERPRSTVLTALSSLVPASLAAALLRGQSIDPSAPVAQLPRDARRRLADALTAWPLGVTGTRGYNWAEVTAGGVALGEVDPSTMESRVCRGLYLVGEILDVDGRIGGFNFQWAWSSAQAAARGLSRRGRGAGATSRPPGPWTRPARSRLSTEPVGAATLLRASPWL